MQIPKLFILTIPTPPKKEWDAYVLYIHFEIHSCLRIKQFLNLATKVKIIF